MTLENGFYRLSLGTASYSLRQVQMAGWTQTTQDPAPLVAVSSSYFSVDFGNINALGPPTLVVPQFVNRETQHHFDVRFAASPGYTVGLTATYVTTDGPLQPGSYRVTIGTGLTDTSNNHLVSSYVRTFSTANFAAPKFH